MNYLCTISTNPTSTTKSPQAETLNSFWGDLPTLGMHVSCPSCHSTEINRQHIPLPDGAYHIKATCAACGRFIKFLPHEPPRFHFGKHQGETVAEVASKDRGYLKWCLSENVVKGRLKNALEAVVSA